MCSWPRSPDASYPSVTNTVLPIGRARQVASDLSAPGPSGMSRAPVVRRVGGQTSPIGWEVGQPFGHLQAAAPPSRIDVCPVSLLRVYAQDVRRPGEVFMFATIKSLIPEPRQAEQPHNYVGRHRQPDTIAARASVAVIPGPPEAATAAT